MDEVIIKTTKTIKGLFSVALPPGEYEAGYNKNGAVFIKLPHGQTLGVKPGEFEFVKAPEHLLDRWRTSELGEMIANSLRNGSSMLRGGA